MSGYMMLLCCLALNPKTGQYDLGQDKAFWMLSHITLAQPPPLPPTTSKWLTLGKTVLGTIRGAGTIKPTEKGLVNIGGWTTKAVLIRALTPVGGYFSVLLEPMVVFTYLSII